MPGLCIIPARALEDESLTDRDRRALLAIGKFTGRDGGNVFAKRETLAQTARMDVAHFRRSLRTLVERGYVRCVHRVKADGSPATNLLSIVLDEPIPEGAVLAPSSVEMDGGDGAESAPSVGATAARREGATPAPKTTPYNDPTERPPATAAAGATPMRPLQQLAAAVNRAFDEKHGPNRNPILSSTGTNLLEAITAAGIPIDWAVRAVYEAALKCDNPKVRSVEYFRDGILERWAREQARADASAFTPVVVEAGRAKLGGAHRAREIAGGPPTHFWTLCADGGLLASMQSRDTLAERVQLLHRDGRIADPAAFLALVLHVKPWQLAEIKFRKERDERLAAALASFTAPAQEVA